MRFIFTLSICIEGNEKKIIMKDKRFESGLCNSSDNLFQRHGFEINTHRIFISIVNKKSCIKCSFMDKVEGRCSKFETVQLLSTCS